jgi:hypothetical protein
LQRGSLADLYLVLDRHLANFIIDLTTYGAWCGVVKIVQDSLFIMGNDQQLFTRNIDITGKQDRNLIGLATSYGSCLPTGLKITSDFLYWYQRWSYLFSYYIIDG